MKNITITKPDQAELDKMGVFEWPIWTKEVSRFDWHYDSTETCYILEGKASVETGDGNVVEFAKGDLVTFPEGLTCVWGIKEPIRKHYKFD